MRLSICIFLFSLISILCCAEGRDGIRLDNNAVDNSRISLSNNGGEMIFNTEDVDSAWIKVPWSNGDYYYHNTLTKENRDEVPSCLNK